MKLINRLKERMGETKIFQKGSMIILLLMQMVALILAYYQGPFYHLKEVPELDKKASIKKSCYVAISSILNKKSSNILFDESLISQMKEDAYRFLIFQEKKKFLM